MFSPANVSIFISALASFHVLAIPVSLGAVSFLGEGGGPLASIWDRLPFTSDFPLVSSMFFTRPLLFPFCVNILGSDGGFGSGSGYGGGVLIGCNCLMFGNSGGVLIGCSGWILGDPGGIGEDGLTTLGDSGGVGSRDETLALGDGGGDFEVWEIAG